MDLIILFAAILSAASAEVVNLQGGQIHHISLNTPQPDQLNYKLLTSPGNVIRVYCDDFRLPVGRENPCQYGGVTFNDGKNEVKTCGRVKLPIKYKSESNELSVAITLKYGGFVECIIKSSESPKPVEIDLEKHDTVYVINTEKEDRKPYFDKAWSITTRPGTKISVQCGLSLQEYHDGCYQNVIFINTGDGEREHCGTQDLVEFSKGTKLTIRIQMDKFGDRNIKCILQSVTGPHANEFENLVDEEDSSEYGDAPGKASTSCKCGWTNRNAQRIFHGNDTTEGEYPWMVGIRNVELSQRCGGSIITPYHVLTAAHCMYNAKVRDLSQIYETVVSIGTYDKSKDASHGESQYIKVKETFIPIEYTKFEKKYDIAVLYLEKEIRYSKWVGPVCMPSKPYQLTNKQIRVTGWGLDHTHSSSQYMMVTKLRVLPITICDVPEWILCHSSQNSSICYGDSGSPMVYRDPDTNRYAQVSVVSYTINGLTCVSGSGSSNVAYHMEFIKDVIRRTKQQDLCV